MDALAPHERYANFYTDFAFKKLFGTEANKECLIGFLNSLFDGEEVIKDVTYLNTEHIGHLAVERRTVFDVYCENDHGEKILIEMQKAEQRYFKDRSIYYSTFAIQDQAPKGAWDFELKRVYTIGILNFTFDDSDDDYMHHEVKLFDTKTHRLFYDKLTYVYLEMPKFRKTEAELVTLMDKWLYAMKNLNTLIERPQALQEAVFKRFFEAAEIANFTKNEIRDYRESQKEMWDMYAITSTAEAKGLAKGMEQGLAKGIEQGLAKGMEQGLAKGMEQGLAKGLEQGLAKGMEQGMVEGARQMIAAGFSADQVLAALGLRPEDLS